jgi:hypothetical protein
MVAAQDTVFEEHKIEETEVRTKKEGGSDIELLGPSIFAYIILFNPTRTLHAIIVVCSLGNRHSGRRVGCTQLVEVKLIWAEEDTGGDGQSSVEGQISGPIAGILCEPEDRDESANLPRHFGSNGVFKDST